jgi:GNAT superfamily N-acetyltransferase
MITIDLLKNHPRHIQVLAKIWHEVLGKIWMPELSLKEIEALSYQELNQDIPVTYIALDNDIPVGFCTLEINGGIPRRLESPWLGDLVVDLKYQKQGVGKMLIEVIITKAKELGFDKLYLFTFDPSIVNYYAKLGWIKIGMDKFKRKPVTVMEITL